MRHHRQTPHRLPGSSSCALVAFDIDDITDADEGLHIVVRKSKSDQEGEGAVVDLPNSSNPQGAPSARGSLRDDNDLTDA